VVDCARRLLDMGCDDLSLGDTTGIGTPHQIALLLDALVGAGIPISRVAMHFHDTYGQALANAHIAMSRGVRTFDTSTGGIGGSPFAKMAGGNLATEDLLWLCRGGGIDTGVDLDSIVATSRWLSKELDQIGAEPFLLGMTGALVCPRPAVAGQPRGGRHQRAGVAQLRDVRGFGIEDLPRKAVRGEHDERIALRQRVAHGPRALGDE